MAVSRSRGAIGFLIAGSVFFSSTGAVAATAAPTYQPDPWAVLSVMSGGASAVAVCGAAAAADRDGGRAAAHHAEHRPWIGLVRRRSRCCDGSRRAEND